MEFTKLEDEKFTIKEGTQKPDNKYFPDADLKSLGNTKYEFSSTLKKDKILFIVKSAVVKKTILNDIINDIAADIINDINIIKEDGLVYDYHYLKFSYIENDNLVILSFDFGTFYGIDNLDFPIQLNLNNNEIAELGKLDMFISSGIKLSNKTRVYITSCRSYIFESIYREYFKTPFDYSFLNNLDPNKTYRDEFFKENNITVRPIIYDNGLITIPIFEKLGENWILYQHNYDKYKDKLNEK